MTYRIDGREKMAEEKKQLGREQNEDLKINLAIDLKKRLTNTERERKRKVVKKSFDVGMHREKPCPLSKEKRDSTHLRICTETGQLCHDTSFLFSWQECHVFLNSRKNKKKGR